MSAKSNYYKLGLFVISALVIATGSVVVLGAGSLFQKNIVVETCIDGSVQGLGVGAPLKFRGVTVGKIKEITVVAWKYKSSLSYILVRMNVPADNPWFANADEARDWLKTEVVKGLRVRMAIPGVTGNAFLEMDYMDPVKNEPLHLDYQPAYPYLPSAPSYITQLSDSLTRIMTSLEKINIEGLTNSLQAILDSAHEILQATNVKDLTDEAHSLLADLRQTVKHLDELVGGLAAQNMVDDAAATVAGTRRLVENMEKPVSDLVGSMDRAGKRIDSLAANLDDSAKNLPELLGQVRTVLQRLDDLLSAPQDDLEETMANLREISDQLKALSRETRQYPSFTFFGDPPKRVEPVGR